MQPTVRAAAFLVLACAASLGLGRSAAALSLTLSGTTTGPLDAGIGSEAAAAGSQLAFSIGLDAVTPINGYDVTIAWDAAELSLFASSAGTGLPFSSAPNPLLDAGSRVASITLTPAVTGLLFTLTFDVLAATPDGLADLRVFVDAVANGSGISPGSLSLANPAGAGIDVIPEPGTGLLLAAGLALLSARRAAGRR